MTILTPLVPLGGSPILLCSFLRFLLLCLPTQASKFFIHSFCVRLLRIVGEVTQKSKALPYSLSWNTSNPFALRFPCQSLQASQTTCVVRRYDAPFILHETTPS